MMVVNLSIVAEPQERKPLDVQGLHAIQLVHNSQMMEAKTAVGEAFNILDAKGIRAPMSNFHDTGALSGQALLTSKHSPDATHCVAEEDGYLKKEVKEKETVLKYIIYISWG